MTLVQPARARLWEPHSAVVWNSPDFPDTGALAMSKPRKDGVQHAEVPPPYPEEFRREAVQLVRSGRKVSDVAQSLGVTEQSLRTWVKRDQLERRERDDGLTLAEREELRELRRQVKRLEQERDLLKRAAAFFARETETR
jgi:transposase